MRHPLTRRDKVTEFKTITAKFASKCPLCSEPVEEGEKVLWKQGSKARHLECNAKCEAVAEPYAPPAEGSHADDACKGAYLDQSLARTLGPVPGVEKLTEHEASLQIIVAPGTDLAKALKVAGLALEAAGIAVNWSTSAEHVCDEAPVLYFP